MAEGHEPWAVDWLWIGSGSSPNLAVDIGDVMAAKVAALSSHSSQVQWIDDVEKLLREWASATATKHDLSDQAQYVELFTKVQTH